MTSTTLLTLPHLTVAGVLAICLSFAFGCETPSAESKPALDQAGESSNQFEADTSAPASASAPAADETQPRDDAAPTSERDENAVAEAGKPPRDDESGKGGAAAQSETEKTPSKEAKFSLGSASSGKPIYDKFCASCHGEAGKGKGPAAAALNPKPADFTSEGRMKEITNEQLYLVVRDGGAAIGKSPIMPGWKQTLSEQEMRDVTAYVRSLSN